MLTLYYSPGACAMASHSALEEAEADFALEKIDLKAGQQRTPEYLAVNPAGVTPALKTEKGVITQNAAILTFVAETFPHAGLAPVDDPFEMARFNAFNGFLGSSLHPAIGKVLFNRPPLEGEARDQAADQALAKYDLVEQHLLEGPWVFGQRWTLADDYLMVFTRWARQGGLLDKGRFPRLNAHLDLVQARPAVLRMLSQGPRRPHHRVIVSRPVRKGLSSPAHTGKRAVGRRGERRSGLLGVWGCAWAGRRRCRPDLQTPDQAPTHGTRTPCSTSSAPSPTTSPWIWVRPTP
jgi:glutathione S-transferase